MSQQSFTNSARRLYLYDDSATPVLVAIPTTKFDESADTVEDTWFSTTDVVNGVPFENGAVVAQRRSYDCECTMEMSDDATPALVDGLQMIRDCRDAIGTAVRKTAVIIEPDGTATQEDVDIMSVQTLKDSLEKTARISWKLKRRGASAAFTGELPA